MKRARNKHRACGCGIGGPPPIQTSSLTPRPRCAIARVCAFDVPYEARDRLAAAIAACKCLRYIAVDDHAHESFFNLCTASTSIDAISVRGQIRYVPHMFARIPNLARIIFPSAAVFTSVFDQCKVMWPRMGILTLSTGRIDVSKVLDGPCGRCGQLT